MVLIPIVHGVYKPTYRYITYKLVYYPYEYYRYITYITPLAITGGHHLSYQSHNETTETRCGSGAQQYGSPNRGDRPAVGDGEIHWQKRGSFRDKNGVTLW